MKNITQEIGRVLRVAIGCALVAYLFYLISTTPAGH